jgi:hypothetical protein
MMCHISSASQPISTLRPASAQHGLTSKFHHRSCFHFVFSRALASRLALAHTVAYSYTVVLRVNGSGIAPPSLPDASFPLWLRPHAFALPRPFRNTHAVGAVNSLPGGSVSFYYHLATSHACSRGAVSYYLAPQQQLGQALRKDLTGQVRAGMREEQQAAATRRHGRQDARGLRQSLQQHRLPTDVAIGQV